MISRPSAPYLDESESGMAGPQAMMGDVIKLSISVFEKCHPEDRVLILLTDGNDSGSIVPPENAARIASDYGITVYTIAVGPSPMGWSRDNRKPLTMSPILISGDVWRCDCKSPSHRAAAIALSGTRTIQGMQ
jgi:hypothetical protein